MEWHHPWGNFLYEALRLTQGPCIDSTVYFLGMLLKAVEVVCLVVAVVVPFDVFVIENE